MIIVKTKNGDRFINEKTVWQVEHDRKNATVRIYGEKEQFDMVKGVESVTYTSDAQPFEWTEQGSEIERLQAIVKKNISENTDLMVRCNQQASIIEEYAFFLRRISPLPNCDKATADTLRKNLTEEMELLDKKVREKFQKFNVQLGHDDV